MNRRIRIALTALAALTALSTVGVTGVASATPRPTEGGILAIAHNGVAEAVNDGRGWDHPSVVMGWSIGGGGFTDDECQDIADEIYNALVLEEGHLQSGNPTQADVAGVWANKLEDEALDGGCAILYEGGIEPPE